MISPSERRVLFHVKHSCGHKVYWSDVGWAEAARLVACPWCGGETGVNKAHPGVIVHLCTPEGQVLVKVYQRPEQTEAREDVGLQVHVAHRADEECCQ